MKRTVAILLALVMVLGLVACGNSGNSGAVKKVEVPGETKEFGYFTVLVPEGMSLEGGDLLDKDSTDAFTIWDDDDFTNYVSISSNTEEMIDEGLEWTRKINDDCEFKDLKLQYENATFEGFYYESYEYDCIQLKAKFGDTYIQVGSSGYKETDDIFVAILQSLKVDKNGGSAKAEVDEETGEEATQKETTEKDTTKEKVVLDDNEESSEESGSTEIQEMWNGWWYGGMDITGCTGNWEWMNNATYDAAMYVELDENGEGILDVYDYGQITSSDLPEWIAEIECHADELYLYGDSGDCLGAAIFPNDWVFARFTDNDGKIGMGSYMETSKGNRFGYDFTLMKWGSEWEGEEGYTQFIPYFENYLQSLRDGCTGPFDDGSGNGGSGNNSGSNGSNGSYDELLGEDPASVNVSDADTLFFYYPSEQFEYNDDYGNIQEKNGGLRIGFDPLLGASNFEEMKDIYTGDNYKEYDEYSFEETTVCGYPAHIVTFSDWLGGTVYVTVDFGKEINDIYGVSISVMADTLEECMVDVVYAIINSMEIVE